MRAKFTFQYGTALTDEQVVALNEVGLDHPVELDGGLVKSFVVYDGDVSRVLAIVPGIRLELHGAGDPRPIVDLADAVRSLELRMLGRPSDPDSYVNNRVHVHVPGSPLLQIDEVDVLYDSCTDNLGEYLRKGWRIVAVCPQPDQRRPDYVIGRRKENPDEHF